MKRLILTSICLLVLLTVCTASERPSGLRVDLMEFTDTDFGHGRMALVASSRPMFSWVVPSAGNGTVQTAYKIVVNKGETELWNSGWVESGASVAVPYQGPELERDTYYSWSVQLQLVNARGKRVKTSESVYKRFKTAGSLQEYSTPSYPLIAKEEICKKAAGGIYDFKKAAFGKLELTLNSARNDSITVIIGERLKDGLIEHTPSVSSVVYDEIGLRVKAGTHTYLVEPNRDGRNTGPQAVPLPEYAGVVAPFRYCSIAGDAEPVCVKRISYHYPFDEQAASFRCSNDTLNAIWDLCHYSLEPCSFLGIWVDGNRERIPYEYDALIAQLCHYGSDAEYSIDRRTLEWLLQKPTWPTEWILYAVEIAWNDYLWTGDDRALRANYEVLKAHGLDALRKPNGLISTRQGQSPEFLASIRRGAITDIVDWPHNKIEDDGFVYTDFNAVVNALYYRTLLRLASIADRVGVKADADLFCEEAAATRESFREAFYDADKGVIKDGIDTDHAALHSNMMAILCGLLDDSEIPAVADYVQSRGLMCSIFGAHNMLETLYAAGRGDFALKLMTNDSMRGWYNGLRLGTTITLEAWDDSFKPNQDWNHIAGAAPGNAIPFSLMGIRPAEPGFSRVDIRPQPGDLTWAEISLPTIRGTIKMRIDKKYLEVTIPANMTADIWLPGEIAGATPFVTVGSGTHRLKIVSK